MEPYKLAEPLSGHKGSNVVNGGQHGNDRMHPNKHMPADYVLELYRKLECLDIRIWIDGGWGVDALLGRQTRPHSDLDIALEYRFVDKLRRYLESLGYVDVERDDTSKWNFVMGDDQGHEIEFHAFVVDDSETIVDGLEYPRGSLTGSGMIQWTNGTMRHLVAFHSGYELAEKDYRDVSMLCEKFGIPLPEEYHRFRK